MKQNVYVAVDLQFLVGIIVWYGQSTRRWLTPWSEYLVAFSSRTIDVRSSIVNPSCLISRDLISASCSLWITWNKLEHDRCAQCFDCKFWSTDFYIKLDIQGMKNLCKLIYSFVITLYIYLYKQVRAVKINYTKEENINNWIKFQFAALFLHSVVWIG